MTTCKHCGAELPEHVKVCPNCGQQNIEDTDESYLDSLLSSVVSDTPNKGRDIGLSSRKKAKQEGEQMSTEPVASGFGADEADLDAGLENYSIFDELSDDDAIDRMISEELDSGAFASEDFASDQADVLENASSPAESAEEEPLPEDFFASEPEPEAPSPAELVEEEPLPEDFFASELAPEAPSPAEPAEEEPLPEDFFTSELTPEAPSPEESSAEGPEEFFADDSAFEKLFADESALEEAAAKEPAPKELTEAESVASIFDGFSFDEPEIEEFQPESDNIFGTADAFSLSSDLIEGLDEQDMAALDNLFQEIDEKEASGKGTEESDSLLHLLDEEADDDKGQSGKGKKKKKKDSGSLLVKLFGNVPIDPSKIKHEPTPEEIAEKKQAKAEKKKQAAEEKKKAADEKKAAAQAAKEEKAKLAQLAKEEKKAKKMEKARLILEEMKDTRINRAGAAIVFFVFALLALLLIAGSNLITYNLAIHNAEKSFQMALNNSPKYYNDAYSQIYGLESKLHEDDMEFYDKVMTVMFVNKQLNSYNSYVAMGDEAAALDSLIKGLKRYEKYSMYAILMGYEDIQNDLDYVRSLILAVLDSQYGVSLDEAMLLVKEQSATEYTKAVYNIVKQRYGQ